MDTSAETLQETCPLCKKDFGEGNPSNICKLLKKGADKVNAASHKRGRDAVVTEGLRVHRIAVNCMPMNGIYKHH